ncbi:MAG: hypothetical protein IPM51_07540 [Sphingobacteriaceae bacterium]|nr:hypothetical protein [Sphingobacteriaceae bacterium]
MRNFILSIFCIVNLLGFGQDTLFFINQKKLAVVLLEINPESIKYKRFDNKEGATYTELISKLQYVKLQNGVIEKFNNEPIKVANTNENKERDSLIYNSNKEADPFFDGDKPDVLIFKSGKKTEAKVLIVNENEVKYKLFNFQDGPTYHAQKSELNSIQYGNGRSQNLSNNSESSTINNNTASNNKVNTENKSDKEEKEDKEDEITETKSGYADPAKIYGAPTLAGETNASLYARGQKDAMIYYKGYGGGLGSGCAALGCTPILGLIPAVIVSNTEPDHLNLNMPYSIYSSQIEYRRGYTETAYRIKKKRTWAGFGIGSGIFIGIGILAAFAR